MHVKCHCVVDTGKRIYRWRTALWRIAFPRSEVDVRGKRWPSGHVWAQTCNQFWLRPMHFWSRKQLLDTVFLNLLATFHKLPLYATGITRFTDTRTRMVWQKGKQQATEACLTAIKRETFLNVLDPDGLQVFAYDTGCQGAGYLIPSVWRTIRRWSKAKRSSQPHSGIVLSVRSKTFEDKGPLGRAAQRLHPQSVLHASFTDEINDDIKQHRRALTIRLANTSVDE